MNCRLDVRLLDMCGGFHSSRLTSTPTLGLFNPRDGSNLGTERGKVDGVCGLNVLGLKATHWDSFKRGGLKALPANLGAESPLPDVDQI